MASYNQVSLGSTDKESVKKLQELLNSNGNYNLAVDGIFGKNTLAAVKDYQTNNSLAVDGIVGTNTWNALTKANSTTTEATTPEAATPEETAPKFEYTPYTPSDTVNQAYAMLQEHMAQKPGEYTSAWQTQLNDTINKILNREKFSYDLNGDALYQQYKDQYTTQGKMASMDVMGQAQAMTGGYGNSYAQTAGQQAYQGYLQQLNERVPELYQLALNQYNAEGDALYDQASLMASMEEQDYGRHRDNVSDYYTEMNRLADEARYQEELDYGKWADNNNFTYQQYRDSVTDSQWQAQFDEAKRQYDEQMALSKKSSSGGNNKKVDDPEEDPVSSVSEADIKKMQKALGVKMDGKWGEKSSAAAGGLTVEEAWEAYQNGTLVKPTYSSIARDLDNLIAGGAKKSEISAAVRDAVADGYITQNQAQQLLSTYVPKGYSY